MKKWQICVLWCVALVLTGCASSKLGVRYPHAAATDAEISRDLQRLPQDLTAYARIHDDAQKPLVSHSVQQEMAKKYVESFYAPWKREKTLFSADEAFYIARSHPQGRLGYAENLRPITREAWESLLANANKEAFPSQNSHGIVVANTSLRALPTHKPFFKSPEIAGEGYPFDYFSHASLWVGSPVYISHRSADGMWFFIETQRVSGWVPIRDIALVSEAFKTSWQTKPLGAVMQDGVVLGGAPMRRTATFSGLHSGLGASAVVAHVGTLLPLEGNAVVYPLRDVNGQAIVSTTPLRDLQVSPGVTGLRAHGAPLIAPFPQVLTPQVLARVGNVMMGQPYGWGGYLENRDCSALMLDIFTPFGLWLPRNSGQQAKEGRVVSLAGLSAEGKREAIRQQAKPFTTLIWLPGHIVLYLGEYEGIPSIYHDVWGVSIKDETGARSRAVIGKVSVTSLSPGEELELVASPASLLDRMGSMIFLGE